MDNLVASNMLKSALGIGGPAVVAQGGGVPDGARAHPHQPAELAYSAAAGGGAPQYGSVAAPRRPFPPPGLAPHAHAQALQPTQQPPAGYAAAPQCAPSTADAAALVHSIGQLAQLQAQIVSAHGALQTAAQQQPPATAQQRAMLEMRAAELVQRHTHVTQQLAAHRHAHQQLLHELQQQPQQQQPQMPQQQQQMAQQQPQMQQPQMQHGACCIEARPACAPRNFSPPIPGAGGCQPMPPQQQQQQLQHGQPAAWSAAGQRAGGTCAQTGQKLAPAAQPQQQLGGWEQAHRGFCGMDGMGAGGGAGGGAAQPAAMMQQQLGHGQGWAQYVGCGQPSAAPPFACESAQLTNASGSPHALPSLPTGRGNGTPPMSHAELFALRNSNAQS